jgi:subtilisin
MFKLFKIFTISGIIILFSFGVTRAQGTNDGSSFKYINTKLSESQSSYVLDAGGRKPYILYLQKIESNADNPEIFAKIKDNNIKLIDYVVGQLELQPDNIEIKSRMESVGVVSILANDEGLKFLKTVKGIRSISEDRINSSLLHNSIPRIGGSINSGFPSTPTSSGHQYTGDGRAVAIIDSNFSSTNPMLTGKIIKSYCYAESGKGEFNNAIATSSCGEPYQSTSLGEGCLSTVEGCGHGILVSSVAAGSEVDATIIGDNNLSPTLYPNPPHQDTYKISGVAKGAKIYSLASSSILHEKSGQTDLCGDPDITEECVRFLDSNVLNNMNKLIEDLNSGTINKVDAVNLSIGGSTDYHSDRASCDNSASNEAFDDIAYPILKSKGVAVVRAAGNDGDISVPINASNANKIDGSSCGAGVVIVGASYTNQDKMASYSNASEQILDLVAPGGDTVPPSINDAWNNLLVAAHQPGTSTILATRHDSDYSHYFGGTSSAAPHVSGAFAVIREQHPNITVDRALKLFKDTADPITDDRAGYQGNVYKRLNLGEAVKQSDVYPTLTTLSLDKDDVTAGDTITLTINAVNSSECDINNTVGKIQVLNGQATKSFPATNSEYSVTCKSEYGDVSAAKSVTLTLAQAPLVVAPPQNLSVNDITTSSATISFTNSTTPTVSSYEAWIASQKVATSSTGTSKLNLSNLQSGKEYTVDIYAVDAGGAKSSAAQIKFSTLVPEVNPSSDTNVNPQVSEQVDQIINKNNNTESDNAKVKVPSTGAKLLVVLVAALIIGGVIFAVAATVNMVKNSKNRQR